MHCLQLIGEAAGYKIHISQRGAMSACQHPAQACPPLPRIWSTGLSRPGTPGMVQCRHPPRHLAPLLSLQRAA